MSPARAAVDWSVRYPRPLLDKLGIKENFRVSVVGIQDQAFHRLLEERTSDLSSRPRKDSDLVFYAANRLQDLDRLADLRKSLKPAGAIWVVRLKGDAAVIKETDVITAARAQKLVDIKVVSFSGTHSALKLVIPLELR